MPAPTEDPPNGTLTVVPEPECIDYLERSAERIEKMHSDVESLKDSTDPQDETKLQHALNSQDDFVDQQDLNLAIALRCLAARLKLERPE